MADRTVTDFPIHRARLANADLLRAGDPEKGQRMIDLAARTDFDLTTVDLRGMTPDEARFEVASELALHVLTRGRKHG